MGGGTSLVFLVGGQEHVHHNRSAAEVGDFVDVHGFVEEVGTDPAGADVGAC